ncbi:hypothetical protein [Haploplasma axanthum]|uniref:Uncharacterized protein n=1 Tax=Haploplasma axanthum TaxID=29552 RepID=A0A449BBV2_HAPAX|nr:hypothetical protein [Haploplasma axanthum]VEU79916.1 Uncharacterised protein [Haploplasma axanthum]
MKKVIRMLFMLLIGGVFGLKNEVKLDEIDSIEMNEVEFTTEFDKNDYGLTTTEVSRDYADAVGLPEWIGIY